MNYNNPVRLMIIIDLLKHYMYELNQLKAYLDQVYAGSVYCGTVKHKAGQSKYTVECDGLVADHVMIRQPYNLLTLCEVQVYGERSQDGELSCLRCFG